jgi:hypothetical protein
MTIRDVNYINDVCRVVLSKPQGITISEPAGTIRISGTPTSLTESSYASPTLDLDFAKTQSVDSRITFSRSTTASYYDSNGFLRFAAVNQPRIQFNPDTKECLGLLMENVSTNIFSSSEWTFGDNGFTFLDADNTFNTTSVTVPTNESGTVRSLIASTTASSIRYALAAKTHIGTEICAFSAFFKQVTNNQVFPCLVIDSPAAGSGVFARFNLVNGTVEQAQITGTGVLIASGIEKLPGGWSRCWVIGRAPASAGGRLAISIVGGNSANGYDPPWTPTAIGDGVQVWGIQYEQGLPFNRLRPSSYIRTIGTAVTKFADSASITGTNFSRWYNQSQGTIFVDYHKRFSGNHPETNILCRFIFDLSTYITLQTDFFATTIRFQGVTSGGNGALQLANTQQGFNRAVGTYLLNRADLVSNGTRTTAVDTLYDPPTNIASLEIGHLGGAFQLNDCIARILYYPVSIDPNVTLGMSVPRNF